MVVCPIARAVHCTGCPLIDFCPAKTFLGDYGMDKDWQINDWQINDWQINEPQPNPPDPKANSPESGLGPQ